MSKPPRAGPRGMTSGIFDLLDAQPIDARRYRIFRIIT